MNLKRLLLSKQHGIEEVFGFCNNNIFIRSFKCLWLGRYFFIKVYLKSSIFAIKYFPLLSLFIISYRKYI